MAVHLDCAEGRPTTSAEIGPASTIEMARPLRTSDAIEAAETISTDQKSPCPAAAREVDRADVGQNLASRSSLTYGSTIDGRGVHYVIVGSAKLVTMVV